MIKRVLSTVVVAMIFTGCVGTVVAKNDVKERGTKEVQNAKPIENDSNRTKNIENNTTSLKNQAIKKAVEVADGYTDGKASMIKGMLK